MLLYIMQDAFATDNVPKLLSCLLLGFVNQGRSYGVEKVKDFDKMTNLEWAKYVLYASTKGLKQEKMRTKIEELGDPIRSTLERIIDETGI